MSFQNAQTKQSGFTLIQALVATVLSVGLITVSTRLLIGTSRQQAHQIVTDTYRSLDDKGSRYVSDASLWLQNLSDNSPINTCLSNSSCSSTWNASLGTNESKPMTLKENFAGGVSLLGLYSREGGKTLPGTTTACTTFGPDCPFSVQAQYRIVCTPNASSCPHTQASLQVDYRILVHSSLKGSIPSPLNAIDGTPRQVIFVSDLSGTVTGNWVASNLGGNGYSLDALRKSSAPEKNQTCAADEIPANFKVDKTNNVTWTCAKSEKPVPLGFGKDQAPISGLPTGTTSCPDGSTLQKVKKDGKESYRCLALGSSCGEGEGYVTKIDPNTGKASCDPKPVATAQPPPPAKCSCYVIFQTGGNTGINTCQPGSPGCGLAFGFCTSKRSGKASGSWVSKSDAVRLCERNLYKNEMEDGDYAKAAIYTVNGKFECKWSPSGGKANDWQPIIALPGTYNGKSYTFKDQECSF